MRITQKDLSILINRLNITAKTPQEWPKVGHFCLDCAYGGYSLHQLISDKGAVRDVFNSGHIPARDLYFRICAFIEGLTYTNVTNTSS